MLIRLSEDEFAEISAAASSVDDALANWARRVLLAAARELNRQATEP
ncbi:hypothetical protein TPY_2359 [Sulfobacillus acidophilus TPY]|nr:hypothetical protein TPY_2359 [Sulfobacillus acidophilus TPY]